MVRASASSLSSLSLSSAAATSQSPQLQQSSQQQSPSQIQTVQRLGATTTTATTTTGTSSGRTDTGAWPCLLDGCNKVFAREADLKRHQRTTKSHSVPGSGVANPCPLCEATFTRSDAMRRHLKSRHQGRTPETLNLPDNLNAATGGPSSSSSSSTNNNNNNTNNSSNNNVSSTTGASSSRGADRHRRAYSPSEETSELSASDSERQPFHHHQHQHYHPTSTSSATPGAGYAPPSRNASHSYYSSPPISPTSPVSASTSSSSNPASVGSHQHGMHHHPHYSHHQDAAGNPNLSSPQVLYQAAMSYEIQHALSSPRQTSSSSTSASAAAAAVMNHHHHPSSGSAAAPVSSSSTSSSSRRDTTSPTSYGMHPHPHQAVSMPMQPHSHSHSSHSHHTNAHTHTHTHTHPHPHSPYHPPYTNPGPDQSPSYPGSAYQPSYPAYGTTSASGTTYASPYTTGRAVGHGHGGGGSGGGYTMMSSGMPWGGIKIEEDMMDDERGLSPSSPSLSSSRGQTSAGGLAALAMQASRVRPMSPLNPGKLKTSTKSELENALGPAGVYHTSARR